VIDMLYMPSLFGSLCMEIVDEGDFLLQRSDKAGFSGRSGGTE
jgi:hypothetical protein